MSRAETIHFFSEGIRCEGDLYRPPSLAEGSSYPALVIGHGFSVARTSLVEEGRQFAEAGYVTLAIDYRHFGGSDGVPRHRLYPMNEVEDFRSAIDWLENQPGVDRERIGAWGTSFGGGIATYVAGHDLRVRACVAQAPVLDGEHWIHSLNREADYLAVRRYLIEARRKRASKAGAPGVGAEEPRVPVGGSTADGFVPMPADPVMIEDVMTWQARTGEQLMHSAPDITVQSFERVLEFDAVRAAGKIAPRAYCIVQLTGRDVYHPQQSIQEAFRTAGEPKRMVSIPIDQLDCYKPDGRAKTLRAAIAFFDQYLK
jgi:acetyl esterase/lipase